jgi:predicted RNA polymerase sigma factor
VTLSSVLHACGDVVGALAALDRAIGLTVDPGVRTFLRRRRERFSGLSSTDEG